MKFLNLSVIWRNYRQSYRYRNWLEIYLKIIDIEKNDLSPTPTWQCCKQQTSPLPTLRPPTQVPFMEWSTRDTVPSSFRVNVKWSLDAFKTHVSPMWAAFKTKSASRALLPTLKPGKGLANWTYCLLHQLKIRMEPYRKSIEGERVEGKPE